MDVIKETVIKTHVVSLQSDKFGRRKSFVLWGYFISSVAGRALGTFYTCISLAVLPAGIIAGILWNFNPNFTFIFSVALGILSCLFLLFISIPDSLFLYR